MSFDELTGPSRRRRPRNRRRKSPPTAAAATPSETNRTRGNVVVRNVSLTFVSQAWFTALALVATPYMVRHLGPSLYGLYILVAAILGYFAFLDLGLGSALTKYVAEYDGAGNRSALSRVVRTGFGLYFVLAVTGALIIAATTPWLVTHVFSVPPGDEQTARIGFYLAALGFLINLPSQTFATIPTALQRFDYVIGRTILFGTLSIVASVAVLAMGYSLTAVFVVGFFITLATALSFYFVARRLLPWMQFRPRIFRFEARTLLTFGVLKASQTVAVQFMLYLDRIVVAAVFPIAAVAYYAIPLSLSQRVLRMAWNVGTATFPAANALVGAGDDRRLNELYIRSMKLTTLLACATSAVMFFYSSEIMRFWLGPSFERHSSKILMILAVANLFFALSTIPGLILEAKNRIRVTTIFSWLSATTNAVLLAVLVPTIGVEGAAWAVLGNAAIGVPLFLYYAHTRELSIGVHELVRKSLVRPFVGVVVLSPLMIWSRARVENLGELAALCVATVIAYFAVTALIGTYDDRDWMALRTFFRRPYTQRESR